MQIKLVFNSKRLYLLVRRNPIKKLYAASVLEYAGDDFSKCRGRLQYFENPFQARVWINSRVEEIYNDNSVWS